MFVNMQGSEPSASKLGDASSASLHHNSRQAGRQNLNVKPQLTRIRRGSLEVFGRSSTLSSDQYHSGNSAHTYPLCDHDDKEQPRVTHTQWGSLEVFGRSSVLLSDPYPSETSAHTYPLRGHDDNEQPQLTRTLQGSLEVFGSSCTLSRDQYHSGDSAHDTDTSRDHYDNEQQQPNIMQLFSAAESAAKSELLCPVQSAAQKTITDEISNMIVEDTQEQILEVNPDERDVFSGEQQQVHNSPVKKVMKWERSPEREELTEAVMAERAAEWGLVLKSDSATGKICGVRTRKLSSDRSSSTGSRRRSSGNWTSPGTASSSPFSGTSSTRTSMRTSTTSIRTSETSTRSSEASDTGSNTSMMHVLPLLSQELKDVLSKFEHNVAFVVSDATKQEFPIIYASAGFFSLTGYSPQEVIGQNCRFLQGPETNEKDVAEIRESIEDGKSFCGHILNYKKDGSTFWNLLSITPIKCDGGQILKYIGMQVEVSKYTEGKRERTMRANGLSESLIRYNGRLQEKAMESVTELAAVFQKQLPTSIQIEHQLSNVVKSMTMGDEAPQKTRRSSGFLSLFGFLRKSTSSHEKKLGAYGYKRDSDISSWSAI